VVVAFLVGVVGRDDLGLLEAGFDADAVAFLVGVVGRDDFGLLEAGFGAAVLLRARGGVDVVVMRTPCGNRSGMPQASTDRANRTIDRRAHFGVVQTY
jgi:hypothetical protein